jgi:hypothetical protein
MSEISWQFTLSNWQLARSNLTIKQFNHLQ